MSQLTRVLAQDPRWARLAVGALLVATAVFALVWIGRASAEQGRVAAPAAVSKSVSTLAGKADAVDSASTACGIPNEFSDMPDMLVSFKLGGTAKRSVIVLFNSEWANIRTDVFVQLTIDGVVQSGPSEIIVTGNETGENDAPPGTHGFNFVSDPLNPGLHVARIQWGARLNETGCAISRSLIVMHK